MLQPPYLPDFGPFGFFLLQKVKLAVKCCNTGVKQHPSNCIQGRLQMMAASMKKLYAGKRDVL